MFREIHERASKLAPALLLLLASLLFSFASLEIGIRLLFPADADGNVVIRGKRLRPLHFEVNKTRATLAKYKSLLSSDPCVINYVYHELLGWVGNPCFQNGTYRNKQGLRAPADRLFSLQPATGVVRIAIFGDSMTESTLTIEESWGYLLERALQDQGTAAEVLNFGVGGYGIDQAYLRWKVEGVKFRPQYVVLGLYPLNVARTTKVFPSESVLTKPRFVEEGGTLRVINSPTIPIDDIVASVAQLPNSELGRQDTYLQSHLDDYKLFWWRYSRFVGFGEINLVQNRFVGTQYNNMKEYFGLNSEGARLTIEIVRLFNRSVKEHGAEFCVLNIPGYNEAHDLQRNRPLSYSDLLAEINGIAPVIRPENDLVDYANNNDIQDLFAPDGHYAKPADAILAKNVAAFFLKRPRVKSR